MYFKCFQILKRNLKKSLGRGERGEEKERERERERENGIEELGTLPHSSSIEVRGQRCGVSSLLSPLCGF